MAAVDSTASQLWSVLTFDRSFVERVEQDPRAFFTAAAIVAVAGAGRGVSPGLEAGWTPIVAHAMAGFVIWILCSALIWNVAHRVLGYAEGFWELTRVLGFTAAPLIGLWLNVVPFLGALLWFAIAIHGVAFGALVAATRAALSISTLRALGVCALAWGLAILLFGILGLFLVGSPAAKIASLAFSASHQLNVSG